MMVHVFRCKLLGWSNENDIVYFDTNLYSEDEAKAQFIECYGETTKGNGRDYPYTYYEYDGEKYYSVKYLGVMDYNDMPR